MNTAQLAAAFVAGQTTGRFRNAEICRTEANVMQYRLNDRTIAEAHATKITATWAGRYTQSTHRHLDAIINACRSLGHTPAATLPSARAAAAAAARTGTPGDIHINLLGAKPWPS